MSRIIICDRCHKEIREDPDRDDFIGYVAINCRHPRTGDLVHDNPFEKMDFCNDCMAAITYFVQHPCECEKILEGGEG